MLTQSAFLQQETRKALLSQSQLEHSKQLYHKMVLEGYLLMACMIRVEFGNAKAERMIDKWISGYDNPSFKQVIEDNLKSVLDIADAAVSIKQCRHWVVMATRYNEFQVPASTSTQSVFDYLTDKLSIGGGSFAKVGPYTGSVIMRCLQTAPGLNKGEKERISKLVGAGQQFTYQLIGASMSRILGHHSSADLLRIIAHELNRAGNLERDEVRKRVRFLVSGFRLSEICKRGKSDQDCLEAVEADFSAHTPQEDPSIPPHLLHPALTHPSNPKPLLDDKLHKLLQDNTPSKPAKPAPNTAGGNPLTNKVGKQPLTQKPSGSNPLPTKLGADHPGITAVGHPPKVGALSEHPLVHHVSEDWPLDVHPEHLTTSADELVNKVNELENPLITSIMENKNPELLKLLQQSGSPELLQTLLSSSAQFVNTAAKGDSQGTTRKEKARQRLRQLLAAFKGNKQKLTNAIKAHARLRLLSYLKNNRNSKLLQLMKMKYKEPLLAQVTSHEHVNNVQNDEGNHPPIVVNFKEKPKTKSEKALELLKLLELKHDARHAKIHPTEMQPGREILDELKDELSTLGFKHKHKPSQYVDNTLVHFGDLLSTGVGLPMDYEAGKAFDSYAAKKHHRNPFQYEEDWKGSLWHTRKHRHHRPNNHGLFLNQPHLGFINRINENSEQPPAEVYPSVSMTPGKMEKQTEPGNLLTEDVAATFGDDKGVDPNKDNLKNVFKDMASNSMDSNDIENLMSNLPGIVGHHVGKGEIHDILAQFGKATGKPVSSEQSSNEMAQLNSGSHFDGEHAAHIPQQFMQTPASGLLNDGAQMGEPDVAALQKHLQPQKIVELAEQSQGEKANSEGPSLLISDAARLQNMMSHGIIDKYGHDNEKIIHIHPNQKVIHINGYGNGPGGLGENVLNFNGEHLMNAQSQNEDNYAGINENEAKPKMDLLNLNGRIQGIEGLEDDKMAFKDSKSYESLGSNGKTFENYISTDGRAPVDSEVSKELKEQENFDADVLENEAKAVHHLSAVKPTTINTNYLESLSSEDFDHDETRQATVTQGAKQSDPIDNYMDLIHKQDAVDEDYAQHYYKNKNNAFSGNSGFSTDFEYQQFEKKSSLKKRGDKKKHTGNSGLSHNKNIKVGAKLKSGANKDTKVSSQRGKMQKLNSRGNLKDAKTKENRANNKKDGAKVTSKQQKKTTANKAKVNAYQPKGNQQKKLNGRQRNGKDKGKENAKGNIKIKVKGKNNHQNANKALNKQKNHSKGGLKEREMNIL